MSLLTSSPCRLCFSSNFVSKQNLILAISQLKETQFTMERSFKDSVYETFNISLNEVVDAPGISN